MKHLKRFPEFIRFVMVGILATALREKHDSQRQVLKKFSEKFLLEKFGSLKKVLYLCTHFPTEK